MSERNSDLVEWAHFDTATLTCQFSGDFLKEALGRSAAAFLSGVPREVLVHEAAHLLQIAGTTAGVRLWSTTQNIVYLSIAAAERVAANTRGVLPVGLFYLPMEILHGSGFDVAIAMRKASIFRHEFLGGTAYKSSRDHLGRLEQAGEIAPYVVPGYAQVERKWPYGDGIRDRRLEMLLPVEGDDTSAEILALGAIHLLEGQSAILEDIDIRQRMIVNDEPPDAIAKAIIDMWNKKPTDPYRVCHELWTRMLYGESWTSADPWELVLIIDLALMLDEGTWKGGVFNLDHSLPFDNFVTILEKMRSDNSLRYAGLVHENEVSFQNRLLSALGYSSTMLELANRIQEYAERAIEVAAEGPLANLGNLAMQAFRRCTQLRLDASGASPATLLLFAPTSEIITLLSELTLLDIGPVQLSRNQLSHDPALADEIFATFEAKHIDRVANEILYGSIGCSMKDHCRLPRRPACRGLTLTLSSYQNQCPRESLISGLAETVGIEFISKNLELIEFVDQAGETRRMRRNFRS